MVSYNPVKYKTPLRYPGGKSRAIKFLHDFLPDRIQTYCEPFMGGASMALYVTQRYPDVLVTVNDAYYPLFNFWRMLQSQGKEMAMRLEEIKRSCENDKDKQREIYQQSQIWMEDKQMDHFTSACSFYIANKCSFSGLASSSFSQQAFDGNFTINNIRKLPEYQEIIYMWNITNFDYQMYMHPDYDQDFIFLDPPYDIKSFLYGKDGDKHKGFDHNNFKEHIDRLDRWGINFMVTYNADPSLIDAYATYKCLTWDLKYTLRSTGTYREDQKQRKELLIYNYDNTNK